MREPKKLLLAGKIYPKFLPISKSTGLDPKTWKKLALLQNDMPLFPSGMLYVTAIGPGYRNSTAFCQECNKKQAGETYFSLRSIVFLDMGLYN